MKLSVSAVVLVSLFVCSAFVEIADSVYTAPHPVTSPKPSSPTPTTSSPYPKKSPPPSPYPKKAPPPSPYPKKAPPPSPYPKKAPSQSPASRRVPVAPEHQVHPSLCPAKCNHRCARNPRNLCKTLCIKCCTACGCVPYGPYGGKDHCVCYRDWQTKRGTPKCP